MAKNKNKKKKSNLKPTSPVKVVLPVVIGLVVVLAVAVVLALVSRPQSSAKVDNPKATYFSVGDLKVTNQEMYESLRSNSGLNALTQIIDSELLKDVEVSDELYEEIYNETVYGDDIIAQNKKIAEKEAALEETQGLERTLFEEEIASLKADNEKAKAKADATFSFNAKSLGLDTPEQIKEYITLVAKRRAYAKAEYAKWVKDGNDFSDTAYLNLFKEKDTENSYDDLSLVLAVKFASLDQAKAYLALLSNPVYTGSFTDGWKKVNDQLEIDNLKEEKTTLTNEINTIKSEIEDLNIEAQTKEEELAAIPEEDETAREEKGNEIAAIQALVTEKQNSINTKNARISDIEAELTLKQEASLMSDKEIVLAFIELYNIYYAYFLRGDVSTYFDGEGNLKDEYKLLKENVHFKIDEEYVTFDGDALRELAKNNGYAQFEFTSSQLTSLFSSSISSLETLPVKPAEEEGEVEEGEGEAEGEEEEKAARVKFYTYSPASASNDAYYVALKIEKNPGLEKSELQALIDELEEASVERQAELNEAIKAIKDTLIDELIESNYDADLETKFLLELRQSSDLKIFDRFLNATYKAAYDYLYGTTLAEKDYPEYKSDGGSSRKLAFSFKANGSTVEYSAQKFFEYLQGMNPTSSVIAYLNQYVLLSNPDYNKVYNPYTNKVYNRDEYNSYMTSDYNTIYTGLYSGQIKSVKAFKFAFENDLFSSYGFTKKYGWKNFLSDYLNAKDEKYLAASLSISAAEENYYLSKYTNEDIQKEAQAIYDDYYSMKVFNMVISTDYDLNGSPDTYNLEGTQKYFTEYQESLVQELTDLFYDAEILSKVTGSTIEAKVTEVVKLYNKATYLDPTWGKFIAAGLKVKAEDSTSYTPASGLVELFNKEMVKIYKAIEESEEYGLGEWGEELANNGYIYPTAFVTEFGYHRVTILGADERIYVDDEKSLDLSKLTIELYKTYQNDKDSLSETVQKAITTYLEPAITALGTTNSKNLLKQELRFTLADKISFNNDSQKAKYNAIEAAYTEYLNSLIAAEE